MNPHKRFFYIYLIVWFLPKLILYNIYFYHLKYGFENMLTRAVTRVITEENIALETLFIDIIFWSCLTLLLYKWHIHDERTNPI